MGSGVWDFTCTDTFAPSYRRQSSLGAGLIANEAEERKKVKAMSFIAELGRRLRLESGEPASRHYLVQKISVAIQRGNAAAILGPWDRRGRLFLTSYFANSLFFIIHFLYICFHYRLV